MELKVKDVVFLLDKKTQNLVPCLVVEIISSVSLEGEKTYHVVETPLEKRIKLEDYKEPWFSSIQEAQSFLMDTVASMIQKTVDKSLKVAAEHYGHQAVDTLYEDNTHIAKDIFENVQSSDTRVKIDLGDGQIGTVTLPGELNNEKDSSN